MEKLNAMMKLNTLKNALELCGVEAEIVEENDMIVLAADLWNCVDGSTIGLEVGAIKYNNWEIEVVAHPNEDIEDILKDF